MSTPEIKAQLDQALAAFTDQRKSLDAFIADQEKKSIAGQETSAKAVTLAEKAVEGLEDAVKRIKDVEQQVSESIKMGKTDVDESVGALFAKSDAVKNFWAGTSSRAKVEFKQALTGSASEQKNTITNSNNTTAAQRNAGVIPGQTRRLTVRDLIPTLNTTANVIESSREATFSNLAAETAEAAQKPESALTFELVTTNIRTIAHFIKVSKQLAMDAPALMSYIDTRMAYGVDKRIDQQIVSGDGTGVNISGMTKSGNYTAYTPLSANNRIDSLAAMIAALEVNSDYYATGILLNPADLWAINTIKDSQGNFIFGDPHRGPISGLWGLPTVASNAVPVGKAIVADFYEAYQWWNRMGTIVEMFEQDSDNVQKNLITIRAEARGALETRLPGAAIYGGIQA